MMRSIYMVMNIHRYGTFEKESQWRGASDRSGHIYIYKTYIDAEFDVESFGMVYLASKGCLNKVVCEKHTFLNVLYRPTVRVSLLGVGERGESARQRTGRAQTALPSQDLLRAIAHGPGPEDQTLIWGSYGCEK